MSETWMEAGIVSGNAARLVQFYETGLGFEKTSVLEFPQGAVHKLRNGRATIKVFQPGTTPADRDPSAQFSDVAGWAYAALHVTGIAEALARAEAAGAEVITGVTNHRPGAHMAMLRDPEGNTWELLEEE